MKRIIPITDLQRQAGQLVNELTESGEPLVVTQRGRAAAVMVSAARYAQIEEDLTRLDELELLEMVAQAEAVLASGQTISHTEVKKRLSKRSTETSKQAKRARQ